MLNSWIVLTPPLLIITIAWMTQRVLLALMMGIISASLIINNFSLPASFLYIASNIWRVSDIYKFSSWELFWTSSNLFLLVFLLLLGVLITLMRASGAAYAYSNFAFSKIKSASGAERSSLFLSIVFFIDDYFSCITVGSVMQAITDRFKIPRVKLAVLVIATTAPLVVLIPLSSWVAEIVGQLRNSGLNMDGQGIVIYGSPFNVYLGTIPFIFYAYIMIINLWYMVSRKLSFGIIADHEQCARETGNLFGGKFPLIQTKYELSEYQKVTSTLFDFIFPLGFLLISILVLLMYWGGWIFFGGNKTLFNALQEAFTFFFAALFCGVVLTLIATLIFFLVRKQFTFKDFPKIFVDGFFTMGTTPIMLILIWTLSRMLSTDLGTGNYLASLLVGNISVQLLPVLLFIFSVVVSSMISSAWATIGILLPIVLRLIPIFMGLQPPIFIDVVPLLFPIIGAIISGAIVGTHLSPVADIILMTSTSTGSYHSDVLRGMIHVALPVVFSTAIAYLITGYVFDKCGLMQSALIGLLAGIIVNILCMHLFVMVWKKNR